MTEVYTRPSTVDGIKRLAKSIRREHGVSHSDALDRSAGIAGYSNYKHALRKLGEQVSPGLPGHAVYLTGYWIEPKTGESGRETFSVLLPIPWEQLIGLHELKRSRHLGGFHRAARDHLLHGQVVSGQSSAQRLVKAAARTLLFMSATGLRPGRPQDSHALLGEDADRLPGRDHDSIWRNPRTNHIVLIDEPYTPAVERLREGREAWAHDRGLRLRSVGWSGMYAPGKASMFLLARTDGPDLDALARLVDQLPMSDQEGSWTGVSAPYRPIWSSPGATPAARTRPRAPRNGLLPPRRSNGAITFSGIMVGAGRRRPAGRMPKATHHEVGQLLQAVLAISFKRAGVRKRIEAVRCELDDWVQREYDHAAMSNEEFSEMYYRGRHDLNLRPSSETKVDGIEKLEQVERLLTKHYPECVPCRNILRRLGLAKASLEGWIA